MALAAAGRANAESAADLVISARTVHRRIADILGQRGKPTRAAATACATRDALV
jgi:DNA-binding NarL/FixJ family response regulator